MGIDLRVFCRRLRQLFGAETLLRTYRGLMDSHRATPLESEAKMQGAMPRAYSMPTYKARRTPFGPCAFRSIASRPRARPRVKDMRRADRRACRGAYVCVHAQPVLSSPMPRLES